MSAPTLLTVSGTIPDDLRAQIAAGRRPRTDYVEMADAFDAELLDRSGASGAAGLIAPLLSRLGADLPLAWACFRGRKAHRVVFTDGEQVGIPYAAMTRLVRRRPRHVMIGHVLSPRKKALLHRVLRLQHRVDALVVYATEQARFAVEELGYRREQVVLSHFMVDTGFWRPDAVTTTVSRASPRASERSGSASARPLLCAVGQERRDYPTLVEAVRQLDVDVAIAAVSPWSKYQDSSAGLDVPANVTARGYDLFELRQLYADAAFVVVPLEDTDFQAGITTILEAMAMGKAVVCTLTRGQTDVVVDGENGLSVPPGDPVALRQAIERLLADPAEAARFGVNGRRWVEEHADLDAYVARLATLLRQ
jgi:glycosyltransferase involved in cell wall biosynthesis